MTVLLMMIATMEMQAMQSLDALWQQLEKDSAAEMQKVDSEVWATAAEELVRAAAAGRVLEAQRAARAFESQGLTFVELRLAQGRVVGVVDFDGAFGGYLLRVGPVVSEVVVQAPHRFFDRHTGEISKQLFASASLRGFFFNTAHRYGPTKDKANGAADMAHQAASPLTAFTVGLGRALDDVVVVQLHGFDEGATDAEAIVSAGPTDSVTCRDQMVLALASVGVVAKTFPEQVHILGGTKNAQGAVLTERGFVHLELSADARQRLRTPDVAQELSRVVARLVREER